MSQTIDFSHLTHPDLPDFRAGRDSNSAEDNYEPGLTKDDLRIYTDLDGRKKAIFLNLAELSRLRYDFVAAGLAQATETIEKEDSEELKAGWMEAVDAVCEEIMAADSQRFLGGNVIPLPVRYQGETDYESAS